MDGEIKMTEILNKQQFLNEYFEYEIIKEGDNRLYNALVDTIITASSNESKSAMASAWEKYKQHYSSDYKTFSESYMSAISHYVMTYKPTKENFDWNKLNEVGSDENKMLHGYLVQKNRSGLSMIEWALINDIQFINQEVQDGQEVEKIEFVSLDELLHPSNEDIAPVELSEDNALYQVHDDYVKPHFKLWWESFYEEQKELQKNKKKAVLTPKFTEYYDNLKHYYAGELIEDSLKQQGVAIGQQHKFLNELMNEIIREKNKELIRQKKKKQKELRLYSNRSILNYNEQLKTISELEYYKEYGDLTYTFAQLDAMRERAFLEQALKLVENKNDRALSDWIIKNIDNKTIQKIIYEKTDSTVQQDVIHVYLFKEEKKNKRKKKYLQKQSLYAIYLYIAERLDFLNNVIEPTKELLQETKKEIEENKGFKVSYVLPNGTKANKAI